MYKLFHIFITFVFVISYGVVHAKEMKQSYVTIDVSTQNEKSKDISPLFFGINTLYWLQDDNTRYDKVLNSSLKSLNIKMMRYPGGEIADNFHWKDNTLNDNKSFPFSRNTNDSKARMDFDEFIVWKKSLNVEAIIVVNLENGFMENDLEKAAENAAEWVKYANIEKKYGIKYWEIGNESYHLSTRYALTAQQYAEALQLFSKKMKAVDSTIKIGAIGPLSANKVSKIEYMSSCQIKKLHKKRTMKSKRKYINQLKLKHMNNMSKAWWVTIANVAKNDFDFAVIHRYWSPRLKNSDMMIPLHFDRPIFKLNEFFIKTLNKTIPITLTEWSFSKKSSLSGIYKSLTLAEMIGDYLKAGIFITNYFPMYKHKENYRTLFNYDDFTPKPIYHMYQAFSINVGNKILYTRSSNDRIYSICTFDTDDNTVALFLLNKSTYKYTCNIKLPYRYIKPTEAISINSKHLDLQKMRELPKFNSKEKSWRIDLPPLSLTIMKFKVK